MWKKFSEVSHNDTLLGKKTIKALSLLFVFIIYVTSFKKVSFDEAQKIITKQDEDAHSQFKILSRDEKVLEVLRLFRINDVASEA